MASPMAQCVSARLSTSRRMLRPVCAKRHAHTDLAGAPLDRIRRDAVEADRSQDQGHQPEERGQPRQQLVLIEVGRYLIREGMEVLRRQEWVDVCEGPPRFGFDRRRRRIGNIHHHLAGVVPQRLIRLVLRPEYLRCLGKRNVVHRRRRHIRVIVLGVFHNADDLELRSQLLLDAEMLADGFAVK